MAFRQVCMDDLGREAVRAAVKRIEFSCAAKQVSFADGVLLIAGHYGDGIAGTVREAEIKACLPRL